MLPLRSPSTPRPQPLDEAVLVRAAQARNPSIDRWAQEARFNLPREALDAALVIAMQSARLDAYRMARVLEEHFLMRPDYELVRLLNELVAMHSEVLRLHIKEWVILTGMRYPAEKGDQIEYLSSDGSRHMGYVRGVDKSLACGYVAISHSADARVYPVLAEMVIHNITQDRSDPEFPPLGIRYEDAPALAAAYERNRQIKAKAPPTAPASRVLGDDEEGPSAA